MHRFIWLGVFAFLWSPLIAWSQEPSAIVPGSRIRITELGHSKLRSGTIVEANANAVLLKLDTSGESVQFPLAAVTRLEVSRGQKGHIGTGVGLGALFGAGMGALIGSTLGDSEGIPSGATAAIGAGVGAGIGMLVGAAIGSTVKSEKWEDVPQNRWQVNLWPAGPSSFTFALSVRL